MHMYNSISNMYQSSIQVFMEAKISSQDFKTLDILGRGILGGTRNFEVRNFREGPKL